MLVLRSRASRTPFFYIYILVKWGPNLNEKRAYTDKRNKPPFPSVDFRVKKVGFPRMFNKSSLIDRCANSHLFSVPARRSKWTRIVPSFPASCLLAYPWTSAWTMSFVFCLTSLSDVQCQARICSIPGTLTNPSIPVVWVVLIYPPRSTYCATRKE